MICGCFHTHTHESYDFWLINFVMVIEMANRLMKQITVYIHQAGAEFGRSIPKFLTWR